MRLLFFQLGLLACTNITAQTTYDVFTYTEPKGYKKELKTDFTSYTKSDNITGTYCIISLYRQSLSNGNLIKDFDNDWAALVAKPFGVTEPPKKDNGDEITGWKTISGAANFAFNGATSMALLTTAKKDNANVAILIVTNAQNFLTTDVDAFFDKIKLTSPKPLVKAKGVDTVKITRTNKTTANNTIPKEILGEWYLSDGNAKITLLFGPNGRYDKGAMVDRRITRNLYETTTLLGKGNYSINGTTLKLLPKASELETYQYRIAYEKNSENKIDKILYLVRPIEGGQMYESAYYFVK